MSSDRMQSAKENKVQGDVVIKAVITEEGDVASMGIVKSLNEECDNGSGSGKEN